MVFPQIWGENGGVLSMRMQFILDSPLARPGSAPIAGRKKGEFRDWTMVYCQEKKGKLGFFISSGQWLAYFRWTRTGQRSVLVEWSFGLTALQWPSPCLVFDPRSAFHISACFPLPGSSSTTISPHCSLRHSSLALNSKCKDGHPWKTSTEVCWALRKALVSRLLFLQLWNSIQVYSPNVQIVSEAKWVDKILNAV